MILRGTVFSRVLEMDASITVVGPDTCETCAPYKPIYLLHGLCGGAHSWADNTMLPYYARNLNALFIMPEAGRSFYTDLKYGQHFFTYVSDELPKLAARLFNISPRREDAAVMGGSMGGFGALKCAFARPDLFGACCAFAPAGLFIPEQLKKYAESKKAGQADSPDGWVPSEQIKRDFIAMFGREMQVGRMDDLAGLAGSVPADLQPRLHISCGLEDGFLPEARRFNDALRLLGFKISYAEWAGGHNWRFFDQALERALAWFFKLEALNSEDQGRYAQM